MMKLTLDAQNILDKLNQAQIDYILIRNFDCLIRNKPYNEKDVDVLISRKDCSKLTELMQTEGFKKLMICPSAGHIGFAKYIDGKFLSFHYHVGGVAGSNIPYLDAEPLLNRKHQKNRINIVSDEDRFLVVLLHSVLDGTKIKPRYKNELDKLLNHNLDWTYIENTLNSKLNPAIAPKLLLYLQQNNYARIEQIIPRIQNDFKYGNYTKVIQLIKSNIIKLIWGIWRLTQNAPLVSFIGMDGTGKTTMTNLLKKKLDRSLITNELVYTGRGKNNILPIQFFAKPFVNKTDKVETISKKNKLSIHENTHLFTKIMRTLSAPLFALDLFLRYWIVIWPKRKTKQIVLTDRYSTDILLMKNVPALVKKILYLFFLKPTLIIYLYNHPNILHKRKPDHPIQDLYRQQKIFAQINKQIKPIKIKSDVLEKTLNKICETISTILV